MVREVLQHHSTHRSAGRRPPIKRYEAKIKAGPGSPVAKKHFRVRKDKVDVGGKVTLRHNSKLYKIGIGCAYKGQRVRLYVADLDIRVVTMEGELIRSLKLDTTRSYQRQNSWEP